MELDEICRKSHVNAETKGFYDAYNKLAMLVGRCGDEDDIKFLMQIWMSHRLMLIVSELAEGVEAIRDMNFSATPKSGGLIEELADTQIRLADFSQYVKNVAFGVTLDEAVVHKMAFNASRERLHGRSL